MAEMRRVTAICNGTAIDHIPSGHALQLLKMLRLDVGRSNPISLVMNVPSGKMGRKDVLKIEDRELNQEELDRLALIAPKASVAIIRNYAVAEKRRIDLGEELVNIARCSFSNCITQNPNEPLPHRLRVISAEPLEIRCAYCGRGQDVDEVADYIL
ncbi:MAG: aspartate carbamoyltransferase regulatory subunit [Euryarchaeota archaeon]|jgi:aspartate carbamoyltransferase regulatory subunit|nr:aspartate carbamoyltransferase regulatory subunit [Euryarchaeota archaeon]MBT3653529.1 aspartate carbamoyltransferase regulatory subunit [Euryarchaeota archaeon]MBT3757633.1 aspartate carbamoyltransferase regulatory subunit [Euryarchaeota archaeon]MBT4050913.1 aspartate carbamoyltransferase regulatory subunit [Euryarchaeota archaeon]MBT4346513.1 aspartate carbamoyltransferase regulatory subunit [Euryarchaeota archaeon]